MKGLEFLNDYRKLAPIFMGVLLIGAIYGRINDANKDTQTYDEHINAAREYREGKIYATAKEEYQKALDMKESLTLYCEIEDMLEEEGNSDKIETWCEKIINKYPNEPVGYEYLIEHYKELEDYERCFHEYDIVKRREIKSEEIEKTIASIKYKYKIEGTQYDDVSDFVNGYAVCEKAGKKGLIYETGEMQLYFDYDEMSATDGNYVSVKDENNEYYFVDLNGDRRINYPEGLEIDKVSVISKEIMPVYTKTKLYYYSVADGLQMLGPYDDGATFSYGVAAIEENGKWYLINSSGEKYTDAYDGFYMDSSGSVVSNNRIFARTSEGYVMLDEELQLVNKTVYEDVKGFVDETYAAVKKDGKWGFIDASGNFKIKPTYNDACSFCLGLAPVKEGDLWGYIDESGRWAIEPIFVNATALNSSGRGFVIEEEDIKWNTIRFSEFNY